MREFARELSGSFEGLSRESFAKTLRAVVPLFVAAMTGRVFRWAFVTGVRFFPAAGSRLLDGFNVTIFLRVRARLRSLALEVLTKADLF